MAYWNHFSQKKYKTIYYGSIAIGEKFRKDLFCGKRRRKDIIMIKLSEIEYMEMKSKKHHFYSSADLAKYAEVYAYSELINHSG